jgi:hypothetical protein
MECKCFGRDVYGHDAVGRDEGWGRKGGVKGVQVEGGKKVVILD